MRYAVLYHDRGFYLFGGTSGSAAYSDAIVRLDAETGEWSEVGSLAVGRQGHGAIFDGGKFLIVGGYKSTGGPVKSEVCAFEDSEVICVEQESSLDNYVYYPELFLVASDFGKDASKC